MGDGDPEDWPAHPVELRQLERSLRCQICQELYQAPVALRCGHTFCSLCIRSCLTSFIKDGRKSACPTCREPTDQADLRAVTSLRDACSAWRAIRQLLLQQHLHHVEQQHHLQTSAVQQPSQAQAHLIQQTSQQLAHQQNGFQHTNSGSMHQQQQRQQPRRASRTPPSGAPSRQVSTYSRGQQQTPEPATTISSNGAAGSGSHSHELDASADSEDEVASQQRDSDPDWSAEDADQQQHQQPRQGTASRSNSKRRLCNSASSSDIGAPAASGSPDVAAAAAEESDADSDVVMADDDSDFQPAEQPAAKRVRSTPQTGSGKENRAGPAVQPRPPAAPQQQPHPQQPGYVACPICSSSVKETFINSHIDSCLANFGSGQGQQQKQQPPAVSAAGATGKQPVTGTSGKQRQSGGASAAMQLANGHEAAAAKNVGRPPASAVAAAGSGAGAAVRRVRRKPLEPPPKLCFELLKDKDLKAKLSGLGLSTEGNKKDCTQRYTAFRNYVLSLKDSGSTLTIKEAAADFTKQQRKIARATSQSRSVAALAAAAGSVGTAAAGAVGTAGSGAEAGLVAELGELDNSYAALIKQTRERMAKRKQEAEQQQQRQELQQHCAKLPQHSAEATPAVPALKVADIHPHTLAQQQAVTGADDVPVHLEQLSVDPDALQLQQQLVKPPTAANDMIQHAPQQQFVGDRVVSDVLAGMVTQQLLVVAALTADGSDAAPYAGTEPQHDEAIVVPESNEDL